MCTGGTCGTAMSIWLSIGASRMRGVALRLNVGTMRSGARCVTSSWLTILSVKSVEHVRLWHIMLPVGAWGARMMLAI